MTTLIRLAWIVVLAILALIAVSSVMAIARPETGVVEKVSLAGLVALCLAAGIAVTRGVTRLNNRIARR